MWDLQFPKHEPAVVDISLQIAKDYPPDVFILGGDNLDCTSVNSHGPDPATRVNQPIVGDFKRLDDCALQRLSPYWKDLLPPRELAEVPARQGIYCQVSRCEICCYGSPQHS